MSGATESPRVEACIAECMARFPGESERASLRYFEAVHQELAPLARQLEAQLATQQAVMNVLALCGDDEVRHEVDYAQKVRNLIKSMINYRRQMADDKARLDWLEAHPRMGEVIVDGEAKTCYVYIVSGAMGLKLREILDAAIAADSKEPT